MPLDLNRVETFMTRLSIRHRESGLRVPFRLRPQQKQIMEQCKDHVARGRRLYVIFLKARRVGISTWASAIQTAHCTARSDAHAAIIAQIKETSKELFNQASGFAKDLRQVNPNINLKNNTITIPHHEAEDSTLRHYTAATVHGTRGLTFSSIHMTEAAFYPYEGAYTAILNTLSQDRDNVCIIETTANGMEGPGQAYYEYWQAAVSGDSEFLPIFLPWYEDPDYVRDPEEAEDAPGTDYERWLMEGIKDFRTGKTIKLGKERIAWHRWALIDKCEGSIDRWRAEYPSCLVANTRVSTDLGIIKIGDAEKAKRTETGDVQKWGPQPVSPVYRLTTKRGRVLEGTFDHPVKNGYGEWVFLGRLKPGETIRLSRPMFAEKEYTHVWNPVPGMDVSITIDEKWALFLGYFMGDGCWYKGSIDICCDANDEDVIEEVSMLCDEKLGSHSLKKVARVQGRKGCVFVKTSGGGKGRMNPFAVVHTFRELGLLTTTDSRGYNKRKVCVPECIWRSPRRVVAHFLAGLFESDATAGPDNITFSSCHIDFARDVQLLLLGMGINSTIAKRVKKSGNDKEYTQYLVRLNLFEALKFSMQVGFRGVRKRNREYRMPERNLQVYRQSEILEDTVEKVEYLREDVTYDFTIKDVHCFGANGILTHNTAEEAFVATGNPAFTQEETAFAESHCSAPLHWGSFEQDDVSGKFHFIPLTHPDDTAVLLWEFPQPRAHYFFGVDTARGEMNSTPGDFAAIVGWNAETGDMCCRFAARVSPEKLAGIANAIGRFYNNACLNVELNNLGYVVMRDLRDRYHYPTQYRWKGRDDKYDGKSATALGFETSERYRKMMFNVFRTSLYRKEVKPRDRTFLSQMIAAKMEMGWRWEVAVGHDDVLVAGFLGWLAKEQYHQLKCVQSTPKNLLLTPEELAAAQIAIMGQELGSRDANMFRVDPTSTSLGALMMTGNDHLRMLNGYGRRKQVGPDRLAGI